MRGAIERCISCILPCGALDVVRVVHANGRVEEISHEVQAWEVMQAHPKHVLRELQPAAAEGRRGPVVLAPTAELRRGRIYFLVAAVPAPKEDAHHGRQVPAAPAPAGKRSSRRPKKPQGVVSGRGGENDTAGLLATERYLSEIMSEKASAHGRDRRRGRVGVWRPHLESISEASTDL